MMARLAAGIMLLVASAHGAFALTAAGADPLDGDDARAADVPAATAIWAKPPAQVVTAPAAPAPSRQPTLSANPLWAIPLSALSGTRERPIFSPSRRPPVPPVAPAVIPKVVAAPRPREPERPQLTLVGTVSGDDEGFGIFLDQSTKAALRLKIGEDFQGWRLRSVQGREAILEKDQQAVILALPVPGTGQPPGAVLTVGEARPQPVNGGKPVPPPRHDKPGR